MARRLFPRKKSASRAAIAATCCVTLAFATRPVTGRDILRGGSSASTAATSTASTTAVNSVTAQTTTVAQRAQETLTRTTKVLQAAQSLQNAARAAARASTAANNLGADPNHPGQTLPDVPDGLSTGGLQVATGVGSDSSLWTGAKLPTETVDSGKTTVTIVQTSQQALLNWKTFNIGRNTTLYFNQTAGGDDVGDWIVFNKINDPSGRPSQILGSIKAEGQVYVINQNGIIFGGSSLVDTHALVASALPINDNLVSLGLIDNTDLQFLFSSLTVSKLANGTMAAFVPTVSDEPFAVSTSARSYQLAFTVASASTPSVTYSDNGTTKTLSAGSDYTVARNSDGTAVVTFTDTGLAAIGSSSVTVSYTRASSGDVTVQKGAVISTPTTDDHVGGKIALIGSNVTNEGTLSSPDGQVILAAGQQVALTAHDSSDASLRGLDVYVGEGGGTAQNSEGGIIEAERGNITMVGKEVNQYGVAEATTSVSLNGRIDLLANYGTVRAVVQSTVTLVPTAAGLVSLGADSVTGVALELDSTETIAADHLALSSQIYLQGKAIYLGANAVLTAPGGDITINAGTWQAQSTTYSFIYSTGQVYLDTGAIIDVSGAEDVEASVADNIVSVELLGTELADSDVQRYGILRGKTIQVDARETGVTDGETWVGTPLADASGYVSLIKRTVGQLSTSGGSVTINAGDSFVMQSGSRIDVSGGWISYTGDVIRTTRLISGGQLYDISTASADITYDAIYSGFTETHSRWNVSTTYTSPILSGAHYESGYIEGGSAGSIAITAPSMALDGALYGNTVTGERQQSSAPSSGALILAFQNQNASTLNAASPTAPSVIFQNGVTQTAADAFSVDDLDNAATLRSDRKETAVLSTSLFSEDGFGIFTLANSDGDITLPAGETIEAAPGSVITMTGANISIAGKISAPAGKLNLIAYDYSPYELPGLVLAYNHGTGYTIPTGDDTRGNVTLASTAVLDAGGVTIDNRSGSTTANLVASTLNAYAKTEVSEGTTFSTTIVKDGGKVVTLIETKAGKTTIHNYLATSIETSTTDGKTSTTIVVDDGSDAGKTYVFDSVTTSTLKGGSISLTGYNVNLAEGSAINVSGGLAVAANGKLTYGSGGAISIAAGQDPNVTSLLGGSLVIDSSLTGYGGYGTSGGSLSIKAPLIQVGGETDNVDTLLLSTDFFDNGGFSSFTLTGIGEAAAGVDTFVAGVAIAEDTVINPQVRSRIGSIGEDGAVEWQTLLLPESLRPAVSLTFSAPGVKDYFNDSQTIRGAVEMGEGSLILAGAKGSVTLSGNTVSVLGSIYAPGGSITVTGASSSVSLYTSKQVLTTAYIGAESVLSVKGATVLTQNIWGYRTGSVLDGGKITLSGNLVTEVGAILDVSGASDELDMDSAYVDGGGSATSGLSAARQVARATVESDGGSIVLTGGQELISNATLLGAAGGASAQGGSLTVTCGGVAALPDDVNLIVTQASPNLASNTAANGSRVGTVLRDAAGNALAGYGYFSADSINGQGFDALTLGGVVRFKGAVTLQAGASLTIADGGIIYGDSSINLIAPYVKLGKAFADPVDSLSVESPFLYGNTAYAVAPTYGTGQLNVIASLIDMGTLVLKNIGAANLTAEDGDVRGDGTFDVAGDITITAGQIYPVTGVEFTIAAYDHGGVGGSVTLRSSGDRSLPLSAGGTLNIYGSTINQGGVLRAPIGTINIGWNGTGTAPSDLVTNGSFTSTKNLTLQSGGIISVSAVDSLTGESVTIPYGVNENGTSWIDPSGTDITSSGLPAKSVNLSAVNIDDQEGSIIDITGGGDLVASRFVNGTGGTNDILASAGSFAIIPGYSADYSAYSVFKSSSGETESGYSSSSLKVGDRIYLDGSNGLPAGYYTLLPARYALLAGAYLVTPVSGTPVGTVTTADGASIVSGYRYNSLSTSTGGQQYSRFEVVSSEVLANRAEYEVSSANTFFDSTTADRLPSDAGKLVLAATQSLALNGSVLSTSSAGRGGMVDISSPADIVIGDSSTVVAAGSLFLDAAQLSSFGAESLLIGGVRDDSGDEIEVKNTTVTVDNGESTLQGPEIILVASQSLTVAEGSIIEQNGSTSGDLGAVEIAGDGLLLAVSDRNVEVDRTGVTTTGTPKMTVADGAKISGDSITLDSSYATSLSANATLEGNIVYLNSGQISILLGDQAASDLKTTSGEITAGLTLAGATLERLTSTVKSLSLLSYSSVDIYGTGSVGSADFQSIAIHAGNIRGYNSGDVTFAAKEIILDNSVSATVPSSVDGAVGTLAGTLSFDAGTIRLGANALAVENFALVSMNASSGIVGENTGSFVVKGALTMATPVLTGATGASQTITSGGALSVVSRESSSTVEGGVGASLVLNGASINISGMIETASGAITLHATTGDVEVSGCLDASGTEKQYFDVIKYTDGGKVTITADQGSVNLESGGVISVAAPSAAGDAGTVNISASKGIFTVAGTLAGQAGTDGDGGSFILDVGRIALDANGHASLGSLDAALNAGGFSNVRSIRVRTGNAWVENTVTAHDYTLSTDSGSINVAGTIDASGDTGGSINLVAHGSVTLQDGSLLTVAGKDFDSAGKGGEVDLEAGAISVDASGNITYDTTALVDIRAGSVIDLTVDSYTAESESLGEYTGTLHLRAPQIASTLLAGAVDVQVAPINGTILNASKIVVEGYKVYKSTGSIDALETTIMNNGKAFLGASGAASSGYYKMLNRLAGGNSVLAEALILEVGAEIVNPTGNLTLTNDWDLSQFRFGPKSAPGTLTLRAAGNVIFNGALSDGFDSSYYTALLLTENTLLSANAQSWSYRIVAGADLTAAEYHQVISAEALASSGLGGSVQVGKFCNGYDASPDYDMYDEATAWLMSIMTAIGGNYQVIRTGSGDIDIVAGGDVQLRNQFATIYTAGTLITDPTMGGTFDVPQLYSDANTDAVNALYPAQYSRAGGNVTITAQGDIERITHALDSTGHTITVSDSSRQLPSNWLYRRGYVDSTGNFGTGLLGDVESTTWWVDFSNFFEGVGTLGGGNATVTAGGDINNIDVVAATNARMPKGVPDSSKLAELGGGDVTVTAGNDINGGVYYVERGNGKLQAGNEIELHSDNTTRSPNLANIGQISKTYTLPNSTDVWLPTTLILGKGDFEVSATGDVTLGPVANAFLLPQGYGNTYWYKTYFSTYATTDTVTVTSLAGDVTLRESAALPQSSTTLTGLNVNNIPLLLLWLETELQFSSNGSTAAYYQEWLRTVETDMTSFATAVSLMPGSLEVCSYSGDINIVGDITLSPSPTGSLELIAAGAVSGLQATGVSVVKNTNTTTWASSTINVSDADPDALPGVASPYAYASRVKSGASDLDTLTAEDFLASVIDAYFDESGATATSDAHLVLQTKQKLHKSGLLHADDTEPVRIYAGSGDLSSFTLYSPKATRIMAGNDIYDISFYIQNLRSSDVSLVAAGGDITLYDYSATNGTEHVGASVQAGDIQISGPGTIEVLAGRDLDLGTGAENQDGTGMGITSIGNTRNPYLPFEGADILACAGLDATGLDRSAMDFSTFMADFLNPATAGAYAERYLPELAALLASIDPEKDWASMSNEEIWTAFSGLTEERRQLLSLDIFFLVLRDAGRDHNDSSTAGYGNYDAGYAAISALFPGNNWSGNISLTSREIKTKNGGDISLLIPGGQITVGYNLTGAQALDQGIFTEHGGDISIFAKESVIVGTSRIFTLRGGNEIIWSTLGDIAAGSSSKTVQSAPPTRVLIDPQSANVETDLAGLATGGGIGALETVSGLDPSDIDLIAPSGAIDAGDAGIRASGNLNVAAVQILNASNIQAGGASTGTPVTVASNLGSLQLSVQNVTPTSSIADEQRAAAQQRADTVAQADTLSMIVVEVVGYGGGDEDEKN